MDFRFKLYTLGFILASVFQLVLVKIPFSGSIVMIAFILSTFRFIFTTDELPKAKYMSVPEVHRYFRSRINFYGYTMATSVVLMSFFFYIFSKYTSIYLGPTALLFWGLLILISYHASIYQSKNDLKRDIAEYIHINTKYKFNIKSLDLISLELLRNPKTELKNLNQLQLFDKILEEDFNVIKKLFDKYMAGIFGVEFESEEIETLNAK